MEQTIEQKLKELKSKIEDHYTTLIDDEDTSLRAVDTYEARATEMLDTVDRVIEWARTYEVS